ncbi:dehydrogenase/reductase [Xylariaceae sp. FL1651]|nr:dehydrogenase/reductase [Xylariaceae sp. FL1651]
MSSIKLSLYPRCLLIFLPSSISTRLLSHRAHSSPLSTISLSDYTNLNMGYKKTILITGGTANLGYQAALNIAKAQPEDLIVISSRSDKDHAADSINQALGQTNTVFIPLDLSDLAKVRDYAKDWAAKDYPPIQSLVLNAGLQFPGPLSKTVDGLESTFGINHVGHVLLFHLLCPYLAPNARIVLTASGTHDEAQKTGYPAPLYTTAEELAHPTAATINIDGRQRYSTSKLCNILWAYALDRHLKQHAPERNITVTSFDPGLMPGTGLAREFPAFVRWVWTNVLPRMIPLLRLVLFSNIHTPQASGAALARLAVDPEVAGVSGEYFEGKKMIMSSKESYDESKQEDLWRWTIDHLAQGEEREKFEHFR